MNKRSFFNPPSAKFKPLDFNGRSNNQPLARKKKGGGLGSKTVKQ